MKQYKNIQIKYFQTRGPKTYKSNISKQEGQDDPKSLTGVKNFEPKTQCSRAFWYPEATILANPEELYSPLYQATESSGSKTEDCFIFPMYFYASNPGAPVVRPFWTLGTSFE